MTYGYQWCPSRISLRSVIRGTYTPINYCIWWTLILRKITDKDKLMWLIYREKNRMSTIPSTKFRRNNILTEFPLTEFRQNSCRKIPRNSVEFFRRNKFPLNSAETFSEIPRKISAEFCKESYGILYILHLFIINPWETFATFIVLLHL